MASYNTTFSGGDEDPISESGVWTSGPGAFTAMRIVSGEAQPSATGLDAAAFLNSPSIGSNQYVECTAGASFASGGFIYLILRTQSSTDGDSYTVSILQDGTCGFYLATDTGSLTWTQIGATLALGARSPGDVFKLTVEGPILSLYLNGVYQTSRIHHTRTSGQPGIGGYGTSTTVSGATTSATAGDLALTGPIIAGVVENLRTGTTDPWTWSHTNGTTAPKGVLVAIMHGTTATDHVLTVTYGGVSMTRVQRNTDTATEPGAAEWWFLGSSVPTGTQTVSVDLATATTDDLHGVSITLEATTNLEVVDVDGLTNTNAANPSVTLQYGGRACRSFSALYSGLTAITSLAAGTGCVAISTSELAGNFTSQAFMQAVGGTSDFAIGVTAVADDVAYAAVAIGEVIIGGASTSPGWFSNRGGWW